MLAQTASVKQPIFSQVCLRDACSAVGPFLVRRVLAGLVNH